MDAIYLNVPRVRHVIKWAAPKPGHEFQYHLAWKHRHRYMEIKRATPWWKWKKINRRLAGWGRAVDRTKRHGQDVIY